MVWLEISDTLEWTWVGESKESWRKKKSILCVFIKKKDNNTPAHWVGHSKLWSLYIYYFFEITPNFYEKEPNITGKTGEDKNPDKKTSNADYANVKYNERFIKEKSRYNKRRDQYFIRSGNNELRFWKHCQFKSTNVENNIWSYW